MIKMIAATICVLATPAVAKDLQMDDPHFKVLVEVVRTIDEAWYRDEKTGAWLVGDNSGDLTGAQCTQALAAATRMSFRSRASMASVAIRSRDPAASSAKAVRASRNRLASSDRGALVMRGDIGRC